MTRKALYRTADGALIGHGFVDFQPDTNNFVRDVPDDFALTPLQWRWDGAQHVALVPTADQLAAAKVDSLDRLQFDVLFTHENAIRAMRAEINALDVAAGRPAAFTPAQAAPITQAQFRDALIARWKALNP
jgi:hypothetical protein